MKFPRFTWRVSILTVSELANQAWWINGGKVCSSKSNRVSKLFCKEASHYRVGLAPKIRNVFHELFLPSLCFSPVTLLPHICGLHLVLFFFFLPSLQVDIPDCSYRKETFQLWFQYKKEQQPSCVRWGFPQFQRRFNRLAWVPTCQVPL